MKLLTNQYEASDKWKFSFLKIHIKLLTKNFKHIKLQLLTNPHTDFVMHMQLLKSAHAASYKSKPSSWQMHMKLYTHPHEAYGKLNCSFWFLNTNFKDPHATSDKYTYSFTNYAALDKSMCSFSNIDMQIWQIQIQLQTNPDKAFYKSKYIFLQIHMQLLTNQFTAFDKWRAVSDQPNFPGFPTSMTKERRSGRTTKSNLSWFRPLT